MARIESNSAAFNKLSISHWAYKVSFDWLLINFCHIVSVTRGHRLLPVLSPVSLWPSEPPCTSSMFLSTICPVSHFVPPYIISHVQNIEILIIVFLHFSLYALDVLFDLTTLELQGFYLIAG